MKDLDVLKSEEAVLSARRNLLDRTPFGGKIEGWRGGSDGGRRPRIGTGAAPVGGDAHNTSGDRYAYDPAASTCRFLRIDHGFYGCREVKHRKKVACTAIQWYGLTSFMGILPVSRRSEQ
jgi:hypothetical protein